MNTTEPQAAHEADRDDFLQPITPAAFTPLDGPIQAKAWRPSNIQMITAFFLLAFIALAAFTLTARSVFIDVQPITAGINIDGGLVVKIGPRYLLHEGDFALSLNAEGYYPQQSNLVVTDNSAQTYRYEMLPLPGFLSINTTPVSGVTVIIDGEQVGQTPLTDLELAAGEHLLVLSSERYQTVETPITIEGRSTQQTQEYPLSPNWGMVSINSFPPGATFSVDGVEMGTTPLTAEVLAGDHDLRLKLPAHKAWTESFSLEALQEVTLPQVTLEAADGIVNLQSNPSNAGVTVDGDYVGQTPLELVLSPETNHQLTFFLSGYEANNNQLRVSSDEETSVTVELSPITTPVTISVTPENADLYIDGEYRGNANQQIELLAIAQQLEIRSEGYVSYESAFTPRPGLEQTLNIALKTLEQQRRDSIEPLITNAVGQQLRLLYPATFTMGASRREAGRQANEILREVQLTQPFYISETEVSNAQFKQFNNEHSSGVVNSLTLDNNNQPVVRISWEDAALFCNWLSEQEGLPAFYQIENDRVRGVNLNSTGYRLPTEAEWAWSARVHGDEGQMLKFPWGDQLPPPANQGNYADLSAASVVNRIINNYNDSFAGSSPVASFPANQHGLFDMGGNVAEWVHDYYGTTGQIGRGEERNSNPLGPDEGRYHVVRGSSWAHGSVTDLRLSYRDYSDEPRDDVGFRVARYLETGE